MICIICVCIVGRHEINFGGWGLLHLFLSIRRRLLSLYPIPLYISSLCHVQSHVQNFDGDFWDALMVCSDAMSCKWSIYIRLQWQSEDWPISACVLLFLLRATFLFPHILACTLTFNLIYTTWQKKNLLSLFILNRKAFDKLLMLNWLKLSEILGSWQPTCLVS